MPRASLFCPSAPGYLSHELHQRPHHQRQSALENSGINEHMKGDPIRDGNDLIEADPTAPNLRTDRGDWKGF